MRKIIYLFSAFVLILSTINYTHAANVQSAYRTYLNKLSACSPYIYNVDGDTTIYNVVGVYNRKCIVRKFTYTDAEECAFKRDDLRKYVRSLRQADVYLSSLNKSTEESSSALVSGMENFAKIRQEFLGSGVCISSGGDAEN